MKGFYKLVCVVSFEDCCCVCLFVCLASVDGTQLCWERRLA